MNPAACPVAERLHQIPPVYQLRPTFHPSPEDSAAARREHCTTYMTLNERARSSGVVRVLVRHQLGSLTRGTPRWRPSHSTGAGTNEPVTMAAVRPPSTHRSWPLTQLAAGEATKLTASATSSGLPWRPKYCAARSMVGPIDVRKSPRIGVSTGPGLTELARIPRASKRWDSCIVYTISAAFEKLYAGRSGAWRSYHSSPCSKSAVAKNSIMGPSQFTQSPPAREATLTTAPPSRTCGKIASVRCRRPSRLTETTVAGGAVPGTPATLQSTET